MIDAKRIVITLGLVATAAAPLAVGAQEGEAAAHRTTTRACSDVAGEEVCTWFTFDGTRALEMGATIPMALIESVPADAPMVWPPEELGSVALPVEARRAIGVDHLGLNWEAHGHPPQSFMTQHFDFHFYNITPEAVRAIDCSDASKPTESPAHYALPDIDVPGLGELVGLCVPKMGMHAMLESETSDTEPFEASMMIGYYAGDPIFVEPMVSRELLQRRADFSLSVPQVQNLPTGVRYPRAFRAEYDSSSDSYRLLFSDFPSS